MPILPGFVAPLFETETNPLRFERVCIALYKAAEGVTLVPTSYNYDQGRDGRSIDLRTPDVSSVLCATLSVGLDSKVRNDITHLLSTTKTRAVIYCTARKITDRECDELENTIKTIYPHLETVRVLSQNQLVFMAQEHDSVLYANYPGEINDLQRTLIVGATDDSAAMYGLRLALATSVGDTAEALKRNLLERLILEVLADGEPSSINAVATKLAGQLHLPRSPETEYVRQSMEKLSLASLISEKDGGWLISAQGREKLEANERPAQKLLEGRSLIRTSLAELTGQNLPDQMFDRIWNVFQSAMADAFHEHGLTLVQSVRAMAVTPDSPAQKTFGEHLAQIADRSTVMLMNKEQREELRQAIIDIFSAAGRPAFEWLTEICSVYVMICALGLEPRSARQIGDILRTVTLVPDSDIILSLLCERETNHQEVKRIIRGWQALAGTVSVATPVLQEMAHHAWIAVNDFHATKSLFERLDEVQAERLIANAFVRTYWALSCGKAVERQWRSYIADFRGVSERDYSRIVGVLSEEYGIKRFPDFLEPTLVPDSGSLEAKIMRYIQQRIAKDLRVTTDELDYNTIDKARRDAKLLANVCEARRLGIGEQGSTALVVSSARALNRAARSFRQEFGSPDAVISLPAIATLLAITPGVELGLGSLRAVLFDARLSKRLMPLQQLAYRVIAASELFELPYSRRVTLKRRLREQVLGDARKRVKSVSEVEARFLDPAKSEDFSRALLSSLEKMAIQPHVGRVMRQQQEHIEQQQAQIQALQEELRRFRDASDI